MKICTVKDCGLEHKGLGGCSRHYQQIKKYGRVLVCGYHDKNPYQIRGRYVYINLYLRSNRFDTVAKTIVDKNNLKEVIKHKWFLTKGGYAASVVNDRFIFLHNFIKGFKGIDHQNQNKLDNRESNLRKADGTLNNINKPLQKNNKSGVRGVYFKVKYTTCNNIKYRYEYWVAGITFKGKQMELGRFKTKEEAVKCREQAEDKYFKNYATL
jgi:hypothetical protein